MYNPGDSVWVVTGGRKRAATVHSYLHDYDLYCLVNVEGLPANPGRKGWRAPGWRIFPRDDKPYAGKVLRINNLRLSFPFLTPPKEQPTMIDKSKPFYIVRTPEFGTGAHYTTLPNGQTHEVPEMWRAKQDKGEAIKQAMKAGARGKQFDVFELRLVGSTQPPQAVWLPAKKPRKAKRKVRR